MILVTGAFGQIGSELVPALQHLHGKKNVVSLDINNLSKGSTELIEQFNVLDSEKLEACVKKYSIKTIYHLVSLISAKGEQNPQLAWEVNVGSLKSILDLAVKYQLRVFWPSSIAAFGPNSPRDKTPQDTIMQPTTMYGVTKVTGELLCQYYHLKYGVDVRSLRYPGLISWKTPPGGGTTDYACYMFYAALKKQAYTCFLQADTFLPMMYMDDAIRATLELMAAPASQLSVFTSYNLSAFSFSPQNLQLEINKHLPLTVTYKPDFRQLIADSWPKSIDDSVARKDWAWQPKVLLPQLVALMLDNLKNKI